MERDKSEIELVIDRLMQAVEVAELGRLELDSRLTPVTRPMPIPTGNATGNGQAVPEPAISPIASRLTRAVERLEALGFKLRTMTDTLAV